MGNSATRAGVAPGLGEADYDHATINRGTFHRPKPLLKFHTVHGTNIDLLQDGRVARRKESFCKGLVFSNRPIAVDEIVCIRLSEVGTAWSGVLRFGVTTVDPASFRDIELPKFACPDLTSKAGYWAKALAERYSVESSILHFFINEQGEMYYGIDSVNKGLFLNGINTLAPLWIIIDIYGNSLGVEFVDPSEVNLTAVIADEVPPRSSSATSTTIATTATEQTATARSPPAIERPASKHHRRHRHGATTAVATPSAPTPTATWFIDGSESEGAVNALNAAVAAGTTLAETTRGSTSANNLLSTGATGATASGPPRSSSTRASPLNNYTATRLRFHTTKGVNISLQSDETVAVRRHGEYYGGYAFTERPLKIDEILAVVILGVEEAFSGSLAFGLTSCDPTQVPASRLPMDSDELLERPEYWVCIKDVGGSPTVGDKLAFYVDNAGQVHFSKNDGAPRIIMHVDISIPLWAFFDLYGTTRKVQILDQSRVHAHSSQNATSEAERTHRASSEGSSQAEPVVLRSHPPRPPQPHHRSTRPASTAFNLDALRVALPPESTTTTQASASQESLPISSASRLIHTATTTAHSAFNLSPPTPTSILSTAPVTWDAEALELARLRYNIARRLNQQPASERTRLSTSPSTTGGAEETARSPFSEFLLARRRNQPTTNSTAATTTTLSSSPRDRDRPSSRDHSSTRNAFADLFESHSSGSTSSAPPAAASVTLPLNPSPLFSALATTAPGGGSGGVGGRKRSSLSETQPPTTGGDDESGEGSSQQAECCICMDSRVNAVIYRCGHMCCCFKCAKEAHRRNGDCPVCRTPIIDVIRCYGI